MSDCCKSGFQWGGNPTGREDKIAGQNTYISGDNTNRAVLIVHDVFGWKFQNLRLLADHFAKEAQATVYLPDFFGGEDLRDTLLDEEKRKSFDLMGFIGRNSKDIRGPEIHNVAKELRSKYKKVGAIGYCYGGWAVFQLGAQGNNLVDCISTAHPSILTKEEMDHVAVPTQILAPETDPQFTPELKEYANAKLPEKGIKYAYEYFPGLVHGFAVKCDEKDANAKEGMLRAKNAAVSWFKEFLHEPEGKI